jgi:hypothetical protein
VVVVMMHRFCCEVLGLYSSRYVCCWSGTHWGVMN